MSFPEPESLQGRAEQQRIQAPDVQEARQPSGGLWASPEEGAGPVDLIGILNKIHQDLGASGSRISSLEESVKKIYSALETTASSKDVEALRASLASVEAEVKSLRAQAGLTALMGLVGMWKSSLCSHNRAGICYAWRLNGEEPVRQIYGDEGLAQADGVLRLRVSKAYHMCSICPLFKTR